MQTVEELAQISRAAQDKIEKIKAAERREENGRLVGKTFKYRNSYSCPEKPSDYWWMYSKVTRMDADGKLRTTEFQTDKYGHVTIRFDVFTHHMAHHTDIPNGEFNKAWRSMIAKLEKRCPDGAQ